VVSSKAIGRLDYLYSLALKLKENKKYYRYYKKANEIARGNGDSSRKMISVRRGWCKEVTYDAEEHYKKEIKKSCLQIRTKEEKKSRINGGFAFVSFISNL